MAVAAYDPTQMQQPGNPIAAPWSSLAPEAAAALQGQQAAMPIDPATGEPLLPQAPIPGAPQQGSTSAPSYDPNNPQPYQDQGGLARVSNLPSAAQGLPEEQPVKDLGAVNHAGAAAYLADKVFRGYLQGKSIRDARTAIELQKTTQGLNDNYHAAAENLYNLAQKGVDPQSDEFLAARNQANAAWQAQVDFLGKHVQAMKTDKKTGKQVADQGSILDRIFKPTDPAQVAPAIYEGMQRTGPPVFHQIAPFLDPNYRAKVQQQAQTQGTQTATAGTVAQNAATQAATRQEFDQLNAVTQPTPEQEARKQQLYNAMTQNPTTAAGAPVPGQHWNPIPGQRPYKDPSSGEYVMAVRNSVTGTVLTRPMPAGFVPTPTNATEGKEGYGLDPVTRKPFVALYDKTTGAELEGSRNDNRLPPAWVIPRLSTTSHTDANGVTTTNVSSSRPDLSVIGGSHTPGTPQAASAKNAAAVTSTSTPAGGTVPHGTQLTAHPGAGTPAAIQSLPAGIPKVAAPVTSTPAVAPSAQTWPQADPNPTVDNNVKTWAYRLNTGQAKDTTVPSSLRSKVMDYMRQNNIATVLPETAAQNNSQEAMHDMMPAVDSAIAALEPYKGNGGVWDSVKQRMSYAAYKKGVNPGEEAAALNQALGFIKVAGTAPWTKIGRGVQIMKTVQEHLPNPEVDAPGLAYEKLTGLKQLLAQQESAVAQRHNMPSPGTPGAPHGMSPQQSGVPGATPGQASMSLPGTPQPAVTVDLDKAMLKPFNAGKTRAQVRADVLAHGNKLKDGQ